jgi:hypothetical protein
VPSNQYWNAICWWNLPCLQANEAGLRLFHFCEMTGLQICPGFRMWYSNWTCCVSEVHNLWVMCPAQHGHVHAITMAKLTCQWSSTEAITLVNIYLT